MIVCHCEHTEKTLFFVPVLYRFCAYFFRFSSSLSVPMRSKPPKETLIFGSILAPLWLQLLHTGRCAMVRPRARSPALRQTIGEKGVFCHSFALTLSSRHGADLPPPCHVFALDTIAVLLPHFCPRSSPVIRLFFAALKPIKKKPARARA